jgi:hypothetical protein
MTLAIGKYCAGAGFGVPRVRGVVMVIPGGTVVTEAFGCERGLYERRRRTATLIPDWLSFPTPLTLHPTGVACRGLFCDDWCSVDVDVLVIVAGGDRVEDEACGGVSVGSAVGGLGVELTVGLLGGVTAADQDADGLIDVGRRL